MVGVEYVFVSVVIYFSCFCRLTLYVVFQEELGTLSVGKHLFDINGKNFDYGVYLINVMVDGELISKKITITE